MCAKAIVNAGINEVVYAEEYAESNGLDILKEAAKSHLEVLPNNRFNNLLANLTDYVVARIN